MQARCKVNPGLIHPCLINMGVSISGFSGDLSLLEENTPSFNKQGFINPGLTLRFKEGSG